MVKEGLTVEGVGALKVTELKAELSARGLDVSGRKAVLAARLAEALTAAADATADATATETTAPASTKKAAKRKRGGGEDDDASAAASAASSGATGETKAEAPVPTKQARVEPAAKEAEPKAEATEPKTEARAGSKRQRDDEDDQGEAAAKPNDSKVFVKSEAGTDTKTAVKVAVKTEATPGVKTEQSKNAATGKPVAVKVEDTNDDDEDDEDEGKNRLRKVQRKAKVDARSRNCPYLDTINRVVLDFDFEKLCSVSMSNINVYACLVCGKYFQGRGIGTHAHVHSLQSSHHVFINLQTLKFYCLPDNYEIIDSSLDDIKFVLRPVFAPEKIKELYESDKRSRALDGSTYVPGVMGLNNIKANDYLNVVIQSLARVPPLREFFLSEANFAKFKDPLLVAMAELLRKLFNPRAFKSHVSPHEFCQAVVRASGKRFGLLEQSDPIDFMSWLLNTLHKKLKKQHKSNIVQDTFQGVMEITSRTLPPTPDQAALVGITIDPEAPQYQPVTNTSPFLFLALDVPPPPLFHDVGESIIPQVPLFELLNKFDGVTEKEYKTYKDIKVKKFQLKSLPKYLIMCIKRFTKNTFFVEKNPTIVNFPVKNIELKDYLQFPEGEEVSFKYDLIANVVHDGLQVQDGQTAAGKGTYRSHVLNTGSQQWYELQDLHVTEILPQMITLSESYIQIWERQDNTEETVGATEGLEASAAAAAATADDGAAPMES
eukprot:m.23929 g.23929  ORF g.23929 m.23929 type:complete len:717 (-) comp7336_c0_seq1:152-2302(-)